MHAKQAAEREDEELAIEEEKLAAQEEEVEQKKERLKQKKERNKKRKSAEARFRRPKMQRGGHGRRHAAGSADESKMHTDPL